MKRLTLTVLVRDENEAEVHHWMQVALDAAASTVDGVRWPSLTVDDWGEDEWKEL